MSVINIERVCDENTLELAIESSGNQDNENLEEIVLSEALNESNNDSDHQENEQTPQTSTTSLNKTGRLWDKVEETSRSLNGCGFLMLPTVPLLYLFEVPWVFIPGFSGFCYSLYENDRSNFGRCRKLLNIVKRTVQSVFLCSIVDVCLVLIYGTAGLIYGSVWALATGIRSVFNVIGFGIKTVFRLLTF
jgi:hypothetical protein